MLRWDEICSRSAYQGRWIALDACRYDAVTGRAAEGRVVDVDADLAELCARLQASEFRHCAVFFCRRAPAATSTPG